MKAATPKGKAIRIIRPEFAKQAMRELKAYRKTGKAADWNDVKRKLGF